MTPKQIGIAGVVLGALAWVITIPPITVRTIVPSIVLATLAVAAGAWAATHDKRKLGIEAIVVAVLAIGGAVASIEIRALDARVGVHVVGADRSDAPLRDAAARSARSAAWSPSAAGSSTSALEGMMLMGAFWGVYGADVLAAGCAACSSRCSSGGLLALLHAFFSIHLRANQIISGTAINFLALGITGYFFE